MLSGTIHRRRGRSQAGVGFTLVEIVVALTIVGVLVALLMPAVQWARESARRMNCQHNLRQLAIANHLYHDASLALPTNMGPWSGQPNSTTQLSGRGWIVCLLPQLDQL